MDRCVEEGRLPRSDALKLPVLERVPDEFEVGEPDAKEDLTGTLGEYFDDPVLVRRELVNFGYVGHDNTAGTYTVRKRSLTEEDVRSISRLERHARDLGLIE